MLAPPSHTLALPTRCVQKYVVTHSISEIGWRATDRQEEVNHRQYAYECAIDYQRRHRQLIEIANLNPDADGFFATTLDYTSWESLRTVPARMYSDAQVRAIKASGTQWARSYGATLLIGDRVPVSFATLGDVIGAQAVRFTTLPLEEATFHDKVCVCSSCMRPGSTPAMDRGVVAIHTCCAPPRSHPPSTPPTPLVVTLF
jgi:hypothetical protein